MSTIKDVAKKSGVSVCTVSRALAGKCYVKQETKERIMAAVSELQYRPNSLAVGLKTGKFNTLALVLPSLTNIYFPRLEKYMERFASEKGYMIFLCNAENSLEKEQAILENLHSQQIAGVIITPTTRHHEHIKKLKDYGIPYVYLNRSFEDDLDNCIRIDNTTAAYDAVSYLIENGYRNIGGIFQSFDNMSYEERYNGMILALKEHQLPIKEENFLFHMDELEGSWIPISKMLQQKECPDAIFACNDMLAFGVYRAAYELGIKIPDKLSVVGYDNSIMSDMIAPTLTTFNTPAEKLSHAAIDFIDHYIQTGEPLVLPVMKGNLIIRRSVKKK